MFLFEIFVEATNMIDRKYKPVLTLLNIFIKSDKLPSIKDTTPYKLLLSKFKLRYIIIICLVIISIISSIFFFNYEDDHKKIEKPIVYKQYEDETQVMGKVFNQLESAIYAQKKNKIGELVGTYFVLDYFTLSNKEVNEIGGIDYLFNDKEVDFKAYASNSYYKDVKNYINNGNNDLEVINYKVEDYKSSIKALKGLEDYHYYDLTITLYFNKYNDIIQSDEITTTVTLIDKDQRFSVIALGE